MKFSFGHAEIERIEVDVQGYERDLTGEYWDDHWLTVQICVRVGGFRGAVSATIITTDLSELLAQLQPLYETLNGVAEFRTMEEQLALTLTGSQLGQIELRGIVLDRPGVGNRLGFSIQFDQSHLAQSIKELDEVVARFPPRLK